MGEISVTYVTKSSALHGKLRIDDAGIGLLFRRANNGFYAWDQIKRLSFDDPGRTKASIPALAFLGVIGLAVRTSYTLVTLSVADQDLFFTTPFPMGQWRAVARRMVEEVPIAATKLYLDGTLIGSESDQKSGETDIVDEIRRLGELQASGVVTTEEFEAKKAELLGRL